MNMPLAQDNTKARVLVLHVTVGRIKRSDTRLFLQDAWAVRCDGGMGWGGVGCWQKLVPYGILVFIEVEGLWKGSVP